MAFCVPLQNNFTCPVVLSKHLLLYISNMYSGHLLITTLLQNHLISFMKFTNKLSNTIYNNII